MVAVTRKRRPWASYRVLEACQFLSSVRRVTVRPPLGMNLACPPRVIRSAARVIRSGVIRSGVRCPPAVSRRPCHPVRPPCHPVRCPPSVSRRPPSVSRRAPIIEPSAAALCPWGIRYGSLWGKSVAEGTRAKDPDPRISAPFACDSPIITIFHGM